MQVEGRGQHGLRVDRAQARELDRRAIEEYGIPSICLMESAGRAVAQEVERLLEARGGGAVVVVCGPGNNGADGLVVARTLFNRGHAVELLHVGPCASPREGTSPSTSTCGVASVARSR